MVGDIDGDRPIGLFVTGRFLLESARREASWPEHGTIRLRIALRIFLGLGNTPELAC